MGIIDTIFALLLLSVYFVFAYFTRKTKTFEDFSIGNRNIGFLLLFASISATYIGPGFTMGLTKQGYDTGMFFFFMVLGYAFQLIIVGNFIAPQLRQKFANDTYSIGDIIGGKLTHNNKGLRLFSGIISFGLIMGFAVIMTSAAGDMLMYFFNIPKIWGVFAFTFIIALYSFTGGIKASIYTDAMQFIIFIIILPLLLFFLFSKQNIDIADVTSKIKIMTASGFKENSSIVIIGLILSFTLGELLLPPLIGRILSSKTSNVSKKSFLASGIFLFFWLIIMFLIGIVGSFTLTSQPSDTILLELGKKFLPNGIFGIFVVAMIGVIMSSQDSLINYGSTLFTRDLVGIIKPGILKNDSYQLKISRIATIIIAIASLTFALYIPSIIDALLICYTVWVPTILVVLISSIYLKKTSTIGAYLSMFFGLITSLIWNFTDLKNLFPTIIAGLFISLLGYLLGYLLENRK